MRLDVYLAEHGLCRSRSRAAEMIRKSEVRVNGKTETKPSFEVPDGASVEMSQDTGFVGRGGEKLECAVLQFGLDLVGKICVDLGASTGGFTDCMLRHGASRVFAVDVGTGQLAPSLVADERVVNMENTNIRYMDPASVGPVGFAAADVSFISLKYIFPVMRSMLAPDACAVCLVKPQFEAGREYIGKNGVVKDKKARYAAVQSVVGYARDNGMYPVGFTESPIKGGEGNTEYLLCLTLSAEKERTIDTEMILR
ncbi:MAG: TlyA family RNA methyltransferase [Clostridia bacterium]|nr:TlyA family RNA methyltransferase [Clostridia bacterium]